MLIKSFKFHNIKYIIYKMIVDAKYKEVQLS